MARMLSAGILRSIAAIAMPIALTACGTTDRVKSASPIAAEDYTVRHPIVIADTATSVDIFPSMAQGRLDRHTAKQVYAFAQQFRDTGHGDILVLMPLGRSDQHAVLTDIKHVLVEGGAHSGITVSTYPVGNAALASPIRLSFRGLKARGADQCGQWPNDLASGSSIDGWQNSTYWNFGCATQSMIAAQTSDPRDLVTPRGEEPVDTMIRSRAIESIRKGTDPNTSWQIKNSNIGNVGGS